MNPEMKDSKIEFSDEEILKGLEAENPREVDKVLKDLYVRNFPIIQNFINKNSGNDEDAADVFQNAVLAFYKKVRLGNFQLNCAIQTYLYSICRNLWLDQLRAQKKQQTLVSELKAVAVEVETSEPIEPDSRIGLVAKLMGQLGEDCKKILGLFYFDRMRMKEIAKEMGYANEKVAKNLKGRCMKKLRMLANESAT